MKIEGGGNNLQIQNTDHNSGQKETIIGNLDGKQVKLVENSDSKGHMMQLAIHGGQRDLGQAYEHFAVGSNTEGQRSGKFTSRMDPSHASIYGYQSRNLDGNLDVYVKKSETAGQQAAETLNKVEYPKTSDPTLQMTKNRTDLDALPETPGQRYAAAKKAPSPERSPREFASQSPPLPPKIPKQTHGAQPVTQPEPKSAPQQAEVENAPPIPERKDKGAPPLPPRAPKATAKHEQTESQTSDRKRKKGREKPDATQEPKKRTEFQEGSLKRRSAIKRGDNSIRAEHTAPRQASGSKAPQPMAPELRQLLEEGKFKNLDDQLKDMVRKSPSYQPLTANRVANLDQDVTFSTGTTAINMASAVKTNIQGVERYTGASKLTTPIPFIASRAGGIDDGEDTVTDRRAHMWYTAMREGADTIVDLTRPSEKKMKGKITPYYPTSKEEPFRCRGIEVRLLTSETLANDAYSKYKYEVTDEATGEQKEILRYNYEQWPDHATVDIKNPGYRALLEDYKAHLREKDVNGQGANENIVHCRAGVGRTGTFITQVSVEMEIEDNKLASLEEVEDRTMELVLLGKKERAPAYVQTADQLKMVFEATEDWWESKGNS